jgi:TolB-like protein
MSTDARERWRRVDDIVEAALALEASERPAFVARACGDDAELRRDVESLLAHDRSDDFLEVPAAAEAAILTAAAVSTSLVGEQIGRFEILERIGSGGMGEVYLAHDALLQRRVAIKRLPGHLSADAQRVRRFRQEALATSALNHPNIVTVHEIVEHEGGDLLVTELIDGITLRERMLREALPLATLLDIGLQIARGLAAAHAIGIVHRDVKPENVMIRSDGLVKLLDFGIAKGTRPALEAEATGTSPGSIIGTIGYMSPEQARGLAVDGRTDVWSLGVILYELATGESPFPGATPTDRLAAILERDPPAPSHRRGDLPGEFDRIVRQALTKDQSGRYAGGAELAMALELLASGAAGADELATRTAVDRPALTRRLPRRAAMLAVTALAAVLATTAGIRYYVSRDTVDSLAILPFANGSNDADAEYLGDGLAETLIDQMSRLPSLRVMARATVFRFKGTSDPLAAGRSLGVGAILTGTISRRGDQLLVSAELVRTSTGQRLWGESYDRPNADLLLVLDAIVANVADRLRPDLSQEEKLALRRHGTEEPQAHDLFLKAEFWLAKDTEEADLEARRLFQQAAEKDPTFVEPHLGIAITHGRAAVNGYAPPADSWAASEAEVVKALRLDPGNVPALSHRVNRLFFFEWDFPRVEREYRKLGSDLSRLALGTRVSPVMPMTMFLWARGFTEEAVALTERALVDDPGNTELRTTRADLLVHAGRLDRATGEYRAVTGTDPESPGAWFGLAEVLKRTGDAPGAIEALRRAYQLSEEPAGVETLSAARTESDYEAAEMAVARSRLADLQALARKRYVSPLNFARLHAQIGDREKAFAALETAFAERSPGLVFLKVDRAWDRIRDDARFAALVRRVGIP